MNSASSKSNMLLSWTHYRTLLQIEDKKVVYKRNICKSIDSPAFNIKSPDKTGLFENRLLIEMFNIIQSCSILVNNSNKFNMFKYKKYLKFKRLHFFI